jgi:hypothetical protein
MNKIVIPNEGLIKNGVCLVNIQPYISIDILPKTTDVPNSLYCQKNQETINIEKKQLSLSFFRNVTNLCHFSQFVE